MLKYGGSARESGRIVDNDDMFSAQQCNIAAFTLLIFQKKVLDPTEQLILQTCREGHEMIPKSD